MKDIKAEEEEEEECSIVFDICWILVQLLAAHLCNIVVVAVVEEKSQKVQHV